MRAFAFLHPYTSELSFPLQPSLMTQKLSPVTQHSQLRATKVKPPLQLEVVIYWTLLTPYLAILKENLYNTPGTS